MTLLYKLGRHTTTIDWQRLLQMVMFGRSLGLLSKPDEDLNRLTPDELNQHFAGMSVSPQDSDRGVGMS